MHTVWLNLLLAAIWWCLGSVAAPILLLISLCVVVYSVAHDWHADAAAYRIALADCDSDGTVDDRHRYRD